MTSEEEKAYLKKWKEEQEKEKELLKERVQNIEDKFRTTLLAEGVVKVVVEYDGAGDSGCIENISFLDKNRKLINSLNLPEYAKVEDDLMNIFYDLLASRHSGWEINEGSFGVFNWWLKDNRLEHVHNERITDVNTSNHEGW